MTTKEARLYLERANAGLQLALENAIEMKAAACEIPASLENVSQCLTRVADAGVEGQVKSLRPEIELLQSRMRQLQILLDSAASFYCASVSQTRSEGYDAFGAQISRRESRQLQMEA